MVTTGSSTVVYVNLALKKRERLELTTCTSVYITVNHQYPTSDFTITTVFEG